MARKIRRQAEVFPRVAVAVAHRLVPRLEGLHEIAPRGAANRIGETVQLEKVSVAFDGRRRIEPDRRSLNRQY